MVTLIDSEGSYNVDLIIKNNILYAIWDGEEREVDIKNSIIDIYERG